MAELGNIHHNALVMQEIQNALNAGKEVITHTDAVSVPGWTGAGYILYDPKVGDGAFKIAGGMNGGAYKLGLAMGTAVGLLASGLLWSLAYPPLASIFAVLLVVLASQLIAAFIAVDLVLKLKGDMCFLAGLITGLEIGLIIFGAASGSYIEAALLEIFLLFLDKHIDFPTAVQCKVYD